MIFNFVHFWVMYVVFLIHRNRRIVWRIWPSVFPIRCNLQRITFFPKVGLSLFDYSWHRWYIVYTFRINNVHDSLTMQWHWNTYALMRHGNMHWRYWKGAKKRINIHNQMFWKNGPVLRFRPTTWPILYTGWRPDSISGIHFGPCTDHQLSEFLAGDGECTDTDRSWAWLHLQTTRAFLPHPAEQIRHSHYKKFW